MQANDDDTIAKIAHAVVTRLEPMVEAKFARLEARLSTMELVLAPVGGRTVHDIHNKLMVGTDGLERLSASYEKLCELMNLGFENHQAHLALQRRVNDFEDRMRGRVAELEQTFRQSGIQKTST